MLMILYPDVFFNASRLGKTLFDLY